MNEPQPLQQLDRTYVRFNGLKLSYFAGCDYFRMASDPRVLRAVSEGLSKFGLNVAASRLTTGNHAVFAKLEAKLARFFGAEAALLVSNGYVTNLVAAQALAGVYSDVLLDEKAHPSLKDAAQLLGARVRLFRHLDAADFGKKVRRLRKTAKVAVMTDGMFSHDGSVAPVQAYLAASPANSTIWVDDSHGAGTLGKTGKGTVELERIPRARLIQTITLSKAFGVYGGAIIGSHELRQQMIAKSRMFVGSTPLPLPLAWAALRAVDLVQKNRSLRNRLNQNVQFVREALGRSGLSGANSASPIIAVVPRSPVEAEQIKAQCLKNRVFPSFIKYPGGPENGYFRFVISSEHTKPQLDALVKSLV